MKPFIEVVQVLSVDMYKKTTQLQLWGFNPPKSREGSTTGELPGHRWEGVAVIFIGKDLILVRILSYWCLYLGWLDSRGSRIPSRTLAEEF